MLTARPGEALGLTGDLARYGLGEARVAACPGECGPCGSICGDGVCEPDERTETLCPADCRPDPADAPCLVVEGQVPIPGGQVTFGWNEGEAWLSEFPGIASLQVLPGDADGALRRLLLSWRPSAIVEVTDDGRIRFRGSPGRTLPLHANEVAALALGLPAAGLQPTTVGVCLPCGDLVCAADETPESCPTDCHAPQRATFFEQRGEVPPAAGHVGPEDLAIAPLDMGDPPLPEMDLADADADGTLRGADDPRPCPTGGRLCVGAGRGAGLRDRGIDLRAQQRDHGAPTRHFHGLLRPRWRLSPLRPARAWARRLSPHGPRATVHEDACSEARRLDIRAGPGDQRGGGGSMSRGLSANFRRSTGGRRSTR